MPKHVLWLVMRSGAIRPSFVTGDEAKHAVRVERLCVGECVLGIDGAGMLVTGEVVSVGRELVIGIVDTTEEKPPLPTIEVWTPTPKGARPGRGRGEGVFVRASCHADRGRGGDRVCGPGGVSAVGLVEDGFLFRSAGDA